MGDIEKEVDDKWYLSGESDLSFYDSVEYLYIAYLCYKKYSRSFVLKSCNALEVEGINSVLDVGAGLGATTLLCKKILNPKVIYYQNLGGSQYEFAKSLFEGFNVNMITSLKEINQEIDLILCLELFEHVKTPFSFLEELMRFNPRYIVVSNSFGSRSYGHYSTFLKGEEVIDRKRMGREFNREMRNYGYLIDDRCLKFWNRRPTIWRKK
jgi:SAM-dependent methyltransferase